MAPWKPGDPPRNPGGKRPWKPGEPAVPRKRGSAPPAAEGNPSLAEQASDLVKGLPSAVKGIVAAARHDVAATVDPRAYMKGSAQSLRPGEGIMEGFERTRPLTGSIVRSYLNTGGRLVDYVASYAPGGAKPSENQYAQAENEGRIVATAVEDVANLVPPLKALGLGAKAAGGAATKAAVRATAAGATTKAGRLTKAAEAARAVGQATEGAESTARMVGGAPVYPYQLAARGIAKAAAPVTKRAAQTGVGQGIAERLAARRLATETRNFIRPVEAEIGRQVDRSIQVGRQVDKILPSVDEQAALTLVLQGEAEALRGFDALPPAARARAIKDTFDKLDPRMAATPDAVDIARRYTDGTLPAEQAARFNEALELTKRQAAEREKLELAGTGRLEGQLSPEQLGNEAMPSAVRSMTAKQQAAVKRAEATASRLALAAERARTSASVAQERAAAPVERMTARLEDRAMRVQRERDRLAAAQKKADRAETAIERTAANKAMATVRKDLEREVRMHRAQAKVTARSLADDMEASLFEGGRPRLDRANDDAVRVADALGPWSRHFFRGSGKEGGTYTTAAGETRRVVGREGGVPFDVWLEDVARRKGIDSDQSGVLIDSILADFNEARRLRSWAAGRTRDLPASFASGPEAYLYFEGTPREAARRLAGPEFAEATGEAYYANRVARQGGEGGAEALTGALTRAFAAADRGDLAGLSGRERAIASAAVRQGNLPRVQQSLVDAREAAQQRLLATGQRRSEGVGAAEQRAQTVESMAAKAETLAERRRQRLAEATARARESIEAAPARFRPAIARSQEMAASVRRQAAELAQAGDTAGAAALRQVAEESTVTLGRLVEQGVDPTHLIGGVLPASKKEAGRLSTSGKLAKQRKLASERVREAAVTPRTARGTAFKEAERTRQAAMNVAADEFAQTFGVKAGDLFPGFRGRDLATLANEAGYKAWNPKTLFEEVPAAQLGPDAVLLRSTQMDQFRNWFSPADDHAVFRALRNANRKLNAPILLFSPRWQVGNAVSQGMLMTVAGGMTPSQIARYGREAARVLKEDPDSLPAMLTHSGMFTDDLSWLRQTAEKRGPVGRAMEASANLNQWVDNWGKVTVYLAKKGKGYSDGEAVKRALQVQVDYGKLTPFERNVVRSIAPYYPWAKHITTLALRLPLEHPARVAWTLHIADLYGEDQSQLPDFLKGGVQWGKDRFISVGQVVNPFGDVGGSPLLSPGGAASAVSPAIRLALAAGRGTNVAKGRQLTRPAGTGDVDDLGRPKATPLVTRPKELGYVVGQAFPQTRLLQALPGTPVLRDETGHSIYVGGKPVPTGRSKLASLGRFLGVPLPEQVPVTEIQERARRRMKATQTARERDRRKRAANR